ncbi:MAG TPA: hypothetical protein PLH97_13370, partial [Verrucomicrobiota bacterium]|nr:hypothetical protein [Verrucomicrobiota bacterium]
FVFGQCEWRNGGPGLPLSTFVANLAEALPALDGVTLSDRGRLSWFATKVDKEEGLRHAGPTPLISPE